ncbi:hypothetical protein IQ07DRAFT_606189 [Pyrenochaeta sp. DS3sAY3a]|nr:hypothetical protein IQ07DRAFT_606189 [Pyrenochaeta sp. DS3sAY3a]
MPSRPLFTEAPSVAARACCHRGPSVRGEVSRPALHPFSKPAEHARKSWKNTRLLSTMLRRAASKATCCSGPNSVEMTAAARLAPPGIAVRSTARDSSPASPFAPTPASAQEKAEHGSQSIKSGAHRLGTWTGDGKSCVQAADRLGLHSINCMIATLSPTSRSRGYRGFLLLVVIPLSHHCSPCPCPVPMNRRTRSSAYPNFP